MSGSSWRITLAASRPSVVWVGGIRISTTTTSGLALRTSASSSTALPTWPTTLNPERSSRLARPSRSRASSSATTARSGAGAVPDSAVLVSVVNALSSQDAAWGVYVIGKYSLVGVDFVT